MGSNPNPPSAPLQFERADYASPPAELQCKFCSGPIHSWYYDIAGMVACPDCQTKVVGELNPAGGGFGRFLRAAGAGTVAAAAGALLWFGVAAAMNMELGLIAIAVGLAVGAAVRWGARRRGGWVYQLLAMALTYLAIGLADAMIVVFVFAKEVSIEGLSPAAAKAIAIAFITIAGPILQNLSPEGVIGFFIIGIALYEGWKMNIRPKVAITGPLQAPPRAPAMAAAATAEASGGEGETLRADEATPADGLTAPDDAAER